LDTLALHQSCSGGASETPVMPCRANAS
jgi:hypothetical protein